jgi:tetratricopeptide (TPR) repeat protein
MAKRAESRSGGDPGSKQVEASRPALPAGKPAVIAPPEALALFQRAMEALQRHAYGEASTAFEAIILGYPQERGLLDRARVYLELCARESARRPAAPRTIEERLTAATAALNNDDDAGAEGLARSVLGDDPKHDLALYLLAAVFARRGATVEALDFLGRAIAESPEASAQARTDDDFTSLHEEDAFWTLTEPPIVPAAMRPRRERG